MRHFLWTALVLVPTTTSALAVPPNDECDGPISITGFGAFPFDNTGATASEGIARYCSNNFDGSNEFATDVWFEWTPPAAALYRAITISTCGETTVDTRIAFYDSNCADVENGPLECDDDGCLFQSRISWHYVQPQAYLIRIGSRPGLNGGPGYFRILPGELELPPDPNALGCPSPTQPSPAAALETCNARDRFDAINSTRRQFVVADDFVPQTGGTLRGVCWWGTYLRDGAECRRELVDFFEITYYADDCGAPGEIIAGPFSQEDVTMEAVGPIETFAAYPNHALEYQFSAVHDPVAVEGGQSYWIGITNSLYNNCAWFWGLASGSNGYSIQVDESADTMTPMHSDLALCFRIVETDGPICEDHPPLNDDCPDAIPLAAAGATFDTYGSTTDGPINRPSFSGSPSPCDFPLGEEQVHRDVWFSFEAQCASTVRFAACDSDFDTKLAVYEGSACPPSDQALACDDDACGEFTRQSEVVIDVVAGTTYQLRIGGYDGAWGQGTLTVDSSAPRKTSLAEFAIFARCFGGAHEPCCAVHDFDDDGDIDADDYSAFHRTIVGP